MAMDAKRIAAIQALIGAIKGYSLMHPGSEREIVTVNIASLFALGVKDEEFALAMATSPFLNWDKDGD